MKQLQQIKGFLVDLDGTTYLSNAVLPGAVNFFNWLAKSNKPYLFFSNNPARSVQDYVSHITKIGIPVKTEQIITSGLATLHYLKKNKLTKIYAIGTPSFEKELTADGITLTADQPQALVVAFDTTLTYEKIKTAALLLHNNSAIPYIATNPDLVCPTNQGPIPDCGAIIAMLKAATGREPLIIGKPNAGMIDLAVDQLQIPSSELMLIGDRLYTDIRMGQEQGLTTALVLSGETSEQQVITSQWKPDYIFKNLSEILSELNN